MRWRWRSTAALGSPVVPLVKRRMAISSGSTKSSSLASPDEVSASSSSRVITSMPSTPRDAVDHLGPRDHDGRREPGEDRGELLVGESVAHRREGEAGHCSAEERDRHGVGVEVDEADPFGAAGPEAVPRLAGRGPGGPTR